MSAAIILAQQGGEDVKPTPGIAAPGRVIAALIAGVWIAVALISAAVLLS